MSATHKSVRTLYILSALGVAAIAATVILLLWIGHHVVTEQQELELKANVRNAEQCAELMKGGVLLARLRDVVARHPECTSLLPLAEEVGKELGALSDAGTRAGDFFVLVVDGNLQPVWPALKEGDRDLRPCARHLLEGRDAVYVLPANCHESGEPPSFLCYTSPILREGRLLGGIVIHKRLTPAEDVFTGITRTMAWVIVATQAVLLVVLGSIAHFARHSIARIERRRAKDERLAAVGNLAAGVAHEIRNPLNTIALTCRYLERLITKGVEDPALRAEVNTNFEVVASELARLTRTLDDFVLLAKPTELAQTACDLEGVLDDTLALFAHELGQTGVRLERQGDGPLPVAGDRDRLSQVFANIVRNSIQAMPEGGTLSVAQASDGGVARVAFADTGPGLPSATLHRLFEPYFSTKRSGLGLGLALSLKIVEAHGGSIAVANRPEGGALVTVTLPIRRDPPEVAHAG